MLVREIKGADYIVQYDENTATVKFQGQITLKNPQEYETIYGLLQEVANRRSPIMKIDLRELIFLNSSGIGTLSKFVLGLRRHNDGDHNLQLIIIGSYDRPWQRKSLKNLKRFLPSLDLQIE